LTAGVGVVTVTVLDGRLCRPSWSTATTWKLYAVFAVSPVTVALLVVRLVTFAATNPVVPVDCSTR
jgi:hypothetical protein